MKHWQIQRARTTAAPAWAAIVFLLLLSLAVIAASAAKSLQWQSRADALAAQLQAEFPLTRDGLGTGSGAMLGQDDAGRIASGAKFVLRELERSVAAANVQLLSTTVSELPATADQMAKADLAVRLGGAYPTVKQVLKDVLERFPNVTLSSLRSSHAPNGAVETTALLSVWDTGHSTPAPDAAPAETR